MLRGKIAERSCGYLSIIVPAAMAIGLVATVATVATVAPRPAQACSALLCRSGALLPTADAEVPANAIELIWRRPLQWTADAG